MRSKGLLLLVAKLNQGQTTGSRDIQNGPILSGQPSYINIDRLQNWHRLCYIDRIFNRITLSLISTVVTFTFARSKPVLWSHEVACQMERTLTLDMFWKKTLRAQLYCPLGNVRPLYRTGVSIFSRESFLFI